MMLGRENAYLTFDVGPYTEGVHTGLETKDSRDLTDLKIHGVQLAQPHPVENSGRDVLIISKWEIR